MGFRGSFKEVKRENSLRDLREFEVNWSGYLLEFEDWEWRWIKLKPQSTKETTEDKISFWYLQDMRFPENLIKIFCVRLLKQTMSLWLGKLGTNKFVIKYQRQILFLPSTMNYQTIFFILTWKNKKPFWPFVFPCNFSFYYCMGTTVICVFFLYN